MNISLNPTYLCNLRCQFCYLTPAQLSETRYASLKEINQRLKEISDFSPIQHVDIYGGEISLLPEEYLEELLVILSSYCRPPYNIITNLTRISPLFKDERVHLSVSYDFEARKFNELVFQNMSLLNKNISVLILASPQVIAMNVDSLIEKLNLLSNIISVEIKPYSTNQSNQLPMNFKDFEDFIKQWLQSRVPKKFLFVNEKKIQDSLASSYNAFSDDHIYITPQAKLGVLDFDATDNEYFRELESIDDYLLWSKKEKEKISKNNFCKSCNYKGHCLTEHYRDVKELKHSCNGYKHLLDWYHESFV